MFHFFLHYDDVGHQKISGYFLFIFRRRYTFNAFENLRLIVGSKSKQFKNMDLYSKERAIFVLFKGNNYFLFYPADEA